MKKFLSSLGIACMGGLAALSFSHFFQPTQSGFDRLTSERLPVQYASNTGVNLSNAPDLTQAAAQSVHGVVHVKTVTTSRRDANIDPFLVILTEIHPHKKQWHQVRVS
jgi:hypothetical protein